MRRKKIRSFSIMKSTLRSKVRVTNLSRWLKKQRAGNNGCVIRATKARGCATLGISPWKNPSTTADTNASLTVQCALSGYANHAD